jgi:hypothetical protein
MPHRWRPATRGPVGTWAWLLLLYACLGSGWKNAPGGSGLPGVLHGCMPGPHARWGLGAPDPAGGLRAGAGALVPLRGGWASRRGHGAARGASGPGRKRRWAPDWRGGARGAGWEAEAEAEAEAENHAWVSDEDFLPGVPTDGGESEWDPHGESSLGGAALAGLVTSAPAAGGGAAAAGGAGADASAGAGAGTGAEQGGAPPGEEAPRTVGAAEADAALRDVFGLESFRPGPVPFPPPPPPIVAPDVAPPVSPPPQKSTFLLP